MVSTCRVIAALILGRGELGPIVLHVPWIVVNGHWLTLARVVAVNVGVSLVRRSVILVDFALHLPQSHDVGVGHSVAEVGRACNSLSRLHPVAIRRKHALRSFSLAVLVLMSQVTVRGRFESHNLLVTCRIRRMSLDVVGQSIGRQMLEPLIVLLVTFE